MNVADVQLVGAGDHTFRHCVGAGNHEIITGKINLLNREGKRQVGPEPLSGKGQVLDQAGARHAPLEEGSIPGRQKIDQAEEIRGGEHGEELFRHSLGASIGLEPFVNDGDPHAWPRMLERLGHFAARNVAAGAEAGPRAP